jgi:hypothetical protein
MIRTGVWLVLGIPMLVLFGLSVILHMMILAVIALSILAIMLGILALVFHETTLCGCVTPRRIPRGHGCIRCGRTGPGV